MIRYLRRYKPRDHNDDLPEMPVLEIEQRLVRCVDCLGEWWVETGTTHEHLCDRKLIRYECRPYDHSDHST